MTVQPVHSGAIVPAVTPSFGAIEHDGLENLRRWVAAASDAAQLVTPLVNSAFVPEAYKPKVDPRATAEQRGEAMQVAIANATAAVLQGISLGVDPLVALQQIYIVHGRPGMYAKFMVALVQQRGHEVWTEENTDSRAVVCGRRRGSTSEERVVITMDQARKAGWTTNQAYAKTPADMLWNRAAARVCDRIASDVLKGLPAVDDLDTPTVEVTGTRTVRRSAPAAALTAAPADTPHLQQQARPAPAPVPAGRPPLPGETVEPVAPEGVTDAQLRKLGAVFTDLGVKGTGERAMRLAIASELAGRELASSKDLTRDEAHTIIDTLEADGAVIVGRFLDQGETDPESGATEDEASTFDPTTEPGWGEGEAGE